MDFWVGIFVLAYGVSALWAMMANDQDRRKTGARETQAVRIAEREWSGERG